MRRPLRRVGNGAGEEDGMRRLIVFGVLLSAMAAAPPPAAAQAYASASERGTNPQRTAALQQRLQALGYYRGRVDGHAEPPDARRARL